MPQLKRSKNSTKPNAIPVEVKLRKVAPVEPQGDRERAQLVENVTAMGCEGFLGKPWGFRNEAMIRELQEGIPNQFYTDYASRSYEVDRGNLAGSVRV